MGSLYGWKKEMPGLCSNSLGILFDCMQKTQNKMVTNAQQRIRKSIGRTAYEVTLHFSSTSTENPYDKLKRIILNDCTDLKKIPK